MHTRRFPWLWLAAALLLPFVAGCLDADTLGDEPPTVVEVGTPPLWSNGVGALMRLKCGGCHVVPHSSLSPRNTPDYFDLNHHVISPSGVPGAQTIIGNLITGSSILREKGDAIMPPAFATPLVSAEILALEGWADGGGN